MANPFTIIGLACDILGTWGVAHEILWGYPKRNKLFIAEERIKNEKWFLSEYIKRTKRLPSPPYSKEEIETFLKETHERHDPKIERFEKGIEILKEGHIEKSFYFAFFGILFLTIGFVLQIIGALNL